MMRACVRWYWELKAGKAGAFGSYRETTLEIATFRRIQLMSKIADYFELKDHYCLTKRLFLLRNSL